MIKGTILNALINRRYMPVALWAAERLKADLNKLEKTRKISKFHAIIA